MKKNLKELEKTLSKFSLRLIQTKGYIWIDGLERDKRICLMDVSYAYHPMIPSKLISDTEAVHVEFIRKTLMKELLEKRRASQPLEFPSAGSTFKRPEGYYAGTLIDQCGLKGLTVGGAQVSEKHAGFVINRGGATCADVKELIRQIQERVFAQAGVRLEPEVRIID